MRIAAGVLPIILMLAAPTFCLADSPAPPQSPSGDLAMFSRFFSQVAELGAPTQVIYLNGQPSDLKYPTLQETIGLSDREADLVKAIAVRCEEERSNMNRSAGAVTLSARLDSIDGQTPNKQYAALLRKRAQIIASAIETVRTELGSVRFDVLATFVVAGATKPGYFPPKPR